MPLKAVYADQGAIPEEFRDHYKEQDGKFVLQVEAVDGYALEDVSGLKHVLSAERTAHGKTKAELEKFGSTYDGDAKKWVHAIDPAKAKGAVKRLEEFEGIDPEKEADKMADSKFQAAKTQLIEKHNGELASRDERISALTGTVSSLLIDQVATAALAEAKGSVDLLLPHIKNNTRVKEADGKFTVEVVDKDGNARIGNGKGDPMTIKDLIAEMKASESFGRAFDASGASGSGMQPGGGSRGGSGTKKGDMGGDKGSRVTAIKERFPDLDKIGAE